MKHEHIAPVEATCQGKRPFTSYHAAARQMAKLHIKPKPDAKNIYRCAHCRNWHMGGAR